MEIVDEKVVSVEEEAYFISNGEALALLECLHRFSDTKATLRAKDWYILSQNMQLLQNIDKDLAILRNKLVEQYGAKNVETGKFIVPEEKVGAVNDEYNEVLALEVDVDFQKIPLKNLDMDLHGISNIHLFFQYMVTDDKKENRK